jgi:hypothetical protein
VASDGALPPDSGAPPDSGLPPDRAIPDHPGPLANVYLSNPLDDNRKTSVVKLEDLTDPKGLLTGKWARVWNCVNEDGGEPITQHNGSGRMCVRDQRAKPGPDGTYLEIIAPETDTDGKSSFAETMMYYHVTNIHNHYQKDFGLTRINKSLRSIVNLQTYSDQSGQWSGYANAGFMPKEQSDLMKTELGVDLMQGDDAIIFGYINQPGYGQYNFSFDASVIYHEYTHFAIGGDLLMDDAADKYGVDPTPFALNEALADYFSCSYLNHPKVGSYALGSQARDLTRVFKCPDHIVGESHNDGEIASGALWAVRDLLGAKVADPLLWNAILTFTRSTTFEQAATAILDEVQKATPAQVTAVRQIFVDRGLIGCSRLKEHVDYDVSGGSLSPGYPGKGVATYDFKDGLPAYLQYHLVILDGTQEVTIAYTPSGGYSGSTKANIAVALRRGSEPITYDFTTGKAVSTAQVTLKGADDGKGYKLVLSGSCITKGDLVFQFVNLGSNPGHIRKVKVTQSPTVTNEQPNFNVCP